MSAETDVETIRETVRRRYAAAATDGGCGDGSGSCCGSSATVSTRDEQGVEVFGAALYDEADAAVAGVDASLGCGVPTAVADLQEGETVLDLGSGAGGDVLMDEATRADMQQWTGCIAGALTRAQSEASLRRAGLVDIEIHETHRVHAQASSAIVRAVKPAR